LGVNDRWRFLVGLELEGLGLLPGEDVPAEMSVAGGLLEDRVLQLQVPGAKKGFFDFFSK
jgi:hypothetical protein